MESILQRAWLLVEGLELVERGVAAARLQYHHDAAQEQQLLHTFNGFCKTLLGYVEWKLAV